MFWRVASFTQSSPIDAILDKQSFTLEELLEEDEIIQVRTADRPAGAMQGRTNAQLASAEAWHRQAARKSPYMSPNGGAGGALGQA